MEASTSGPPQFPDTKIIKRKLLKKGVYPTPKIIHTLRKKHIQKSLRKKSKKNEEDPLSDSQKQAMAEESHFQTLTGEYREAMKAMVMVGKPWEKLESVGLRELASSSVEFHGGKLKRENLRELGHFLEDRKWVLDDDIDFIEEGEGGQRLRKWDPENRGRSEADSIRFLVDRLGGAAGISGKDWKFSRVMKHSGLQFTEGQLLKLLDGLGANGNWRHALSVVHWIYNSKHHTLYKSRFVYTKLLAVLGKARRPHEALDIFNQMRGDCQIYPDMAAYHSIAVTLGQAGLLKELLNVIECMRQKPSRIVKNVRRKNWDPLLEPNVVVYNAVLNACVPSNQWKGVFWVFEQLRKSGLKPNGATYGLAMEVMLQSGKYELVHKLFDKMRRSGESPKALTYKVIIGAFWKEGKVSEAVKAVRDMEQRGVVGIPSLYYELARCLCNNGRWQQALAEVEKLKKLAPTKPLEVTFTGMILSAMDGGYIDDCISIFEHMKDHCTPNTGTINAMLKAYGRKDMFSKAKELFVETTTRAKCGSNTCLDGPDVYTYSTMLEASASAQQWEYFEYVYKEMALFGFQLDQPKHAFLLVEASKAGKWHLVEHAFDTILESGEIPHPSLFTQMVCESICQHDYKRAISIINTMSHAPFQVSEKQWTHLFKNTTIPKDSLEKLLQAYDAADVANLPTLANLLRSLNYLKNLLSHEEFDDDTDDCSKLDEDVASHRSFDSFLDHFSASVQSGLQDFFTDTHFEMQTYESRGSNLPSASKILQEWKEHGAKDGHLFQHQHFDSSNQI